MFTIRPRVESLEARDLLSRYIVTDLGPSIVPQAINDGREIVGYDASNAPFVQEPDGQRFFLPRDGGAARVAAINNASVIPGNAQAPGDVFHAVYWSSGRLHDLGTFGGRDGMAFAVNDSGEIAGWAEYPGTLGPYHAFRWTALGSMEDLGGLPGFVSSKATGVNGEGWVVGWSSDGHATALAWHDSILDAIATPGGFTDSLAVAVNNRNWIAGFSLNQAGQDHGWLWRDGDAELLGDLGGGTSQPAAMNDAGQIVGSSLAADGSTHAFLWQPDSGITDLDATTHASGWTLTYVNGINGLGQIVGTGTAPDGRMHGYVLSPIHADLQGDLGWILLIAQRHGPQPYP